MEDLSAVQLVRLSAVSFAQVLIWLTWVVECYHHKLPGHDNLYIPYVQSVTSCFLNWQLTQKSQESVLWDSQESVFCLWNTSCDAEFCGFIVFIQVSPFLDHHACQHSSYKDKVLLPNFCSPYLHRCLWMKESRYYVMGMRSLSPWLQFFRVRLF